MRRLTGVLSMGLAAACLALPTAAAASEGTQSGCLGKRSNSALGIAYVGQCTGHDEPELDPVSAAPGSARDLTWHLVLPANGSFPVDAVGGFGFWTGGTVSDPRSIFGQAFEELQFYPNQYVRACSQRGAFYTVPAPGVYTACSPIWAVSRDGRREYAEFNDKLRLSDGTGRAFVMHERDAIAVHYFQTRAKDGFHIVVSDETAGTRSAEMVLNSPRTGPFNPVFDTQEIGNSLGWGLVHDTPMAFVWEIGHEGASVPTPYAFCVPGQIGCYSYDHDAWAAQTPILITDVTFGDGSHPTSWAAVSDYGGKDEVHDYCGSYGGPFCIYPWFSWTGAGFHFGVHYDDTISDFGRVNQFEPTTRCPGPFGENTTYCATPLTY